MVVEEFDHRENYTVSLFGLLDAVIMMLQCIGILKNASAWLFYLLNPPLPF